MYQLKELQSGNFQIKKSDKLVFEGSFNKVSETMVSALDFCPYEIQVAFAEMRKSRHCIAEFGVLKGFMYTTTPDLSKFNA